MATSLQRKPVIDPQSGMPLPSDPYDPGRPNVNLNQVSGTDNSTGLIIAVVVIVIGAILAYNYNWFGGSTTSAVTQSNTTQTAPITEAPAQSGTTDTETTGTGTTGTGTTGSETTQ